VIFLNEEKVFEPIEDIVRKLPKTDLHVHLDGSLRLETILSIAEKEKINIGADNPEKLKKLLHMGKQVQDLNKFLEAFDLTLKVLQSADSLYRVAYELAEDVSKENVKYIEVRFSPMLHTQKSLKLTTVVEVIIEALSMAQKDFGIKAGIIISGIRNIDPKKSLRLAELSVAYKNRGVVGFDLAGAEYDYPAKHHREAFFLIRSNNVNCTAHAGEAYGPESIHQALHYCGSHRIGHGTRLREDGDMLNYINDHRIPMEICMTSNVQTGAVEDYESHPLKFYYDFGIRVTMNTDNRLICDTDLTKEYMLAARYFDFSILDIREIIINGFKSAFCSFREKQEMLYKAIDEMDALIKGEYKIDGKEWHDQILKLKTSSAAVNIPDTKQKKKKN
jgi:adenosine deaminase